MGTRRMSQLMADIHTRNESFVPPAQSVYTHFATRANREIYSGSVMQGPAKYGAPDLMQVPQFASTHQGSALYAIARVMSHCRCIRCLKQTQRRSVQQQISDPRPLTACGGPQLFLDLSRAFDEFPGLEVFQHLKILQVDPSLCSVLEVWHSHTVRNRRSTGKHGFARLSLSHCMGHANF